MTTTAVKESLRLIVVEDDLDVRQDVIERLSCEVGVDVIASVSLFSDAIEAMPLLPDVALIDLELPDGNGCDLIRHIREAGYRTKCVVFTCFGDEKSTMDALDAGADGYILKDDTVYNIVAAIKSVHAGECPMSPRTASHLLRAQRRALSYAETAALDGQREFLLSPRELELLELVARGFTSKEAARKLGISPYTVSEYLKSVYRKMGVRSRTEAVVKAFANGILATGQ